MRDSKRYLWIILFALLIFGSAKARILGYDDIERLKALHHFWGGEISETIDTKYSASLGILASPLYWLGRLITSSSEDQITKIRSFVAQFNHIILLLFAIWLYRSFFARLDLNQNQAGLYTLLILSCSLSLPYSKTFYSETLWSITAFIWLNYLSGGRDKFLLGCLTALLVWFNPALLVLIALLVVIYSIAQRRLVGEIIFGAMAGLIIVIAENWLERGQLTLSGYSNEGFRLHMRGLIGVLLSPGKGLVWYSPGVFLLPFLIVRSRHLNLSSSLRSLLISLALFNLGLIALYASWWDWGGGRFWGPRFFLFSTISSALTLILAQHFTPYKISARIILGYQAFIALIGMTIGQHYFDLCTHEFEICYESWVQSPLYVFTQPIGEWLRILQGRYIWSLILVGILAYFIQRVRKARD